MSAMEIETELTCAFCNKQFKPTKRQISSFKSGKNVFCSYWCYYKYYLKKMPKVDDKIKTIESIIDQIKVGDEWRKKIISTVAEIIKKIDLKALVMEEAIKSILQIAFDINKYGYNLHSKSKYITKFKREVGVYRIYHTIHDIVEAQLNRLEDYMKINDKQMDDIKSMSMKICDLIGTKVYPTMYVGAGVIYIACFLTNNRISQDTLQYVFGVSSPTIRKNYKMIAQLLGEDGLREVIA